MNDENTNALEMALSRAASWFQIHAEQRLKIFNFYIVLLAVFVTSFIALLKEDMHQWEFIISLCLIVVTFAFKNLDRRTACLIKHAETALETIEDRISSAAEIEQVKLVKAASKKNKGELSYRQIFNIIFGLGYSLAILGIALAVYPWACSIIAISVNTN